MYSPLVLVAAGLLLGMAMQVLGDPIIVGYYASWKQQQTQGVDFSKYTHVNLAFGIPNKDGTFTFDETFNVPDAVTMLQGKNAKVLVSIGGWTGSNLISDILKDEAASQKFMTSIVDYIKANKLDGVDLDWEYPGRKGPECNSMDEANDTPNYLKFLQALRAQFNTEFGEGKKLITMAVYVQPFFVNGAPSTDVSEFAKVVDFANLMQYDINGGWQTESGPNAPLNFVQGKGAQFSFASAIDAWTGAGWPANQLTGGLAFYGRSTTSTADMTQDEKNMYQPQTTVLPHGDLEDAPWDDTCAGTSGLNGQWQWKHLRDQGVLTDPATAADPWVRVWDDGTSTPWLFNPTNKTFISYDDPQSIQAKVEYAASKGLAGAMVWATYMDYNNELIDAVHKWPAGNSSSSSSNNASSNSPGSPSESSSTADDESSSLGLDDNAGGGNHIGEMFNVDDESSSSSSSSKSAFANQPSSSVGGTGGSGESCSSDGKLECEDSGNSAGYTVCLYGNRVSLSCAPGTVCTSSDGSILCGWPESAGAASGGEGAGTGLSSSASNEPEE